MCGGTINQSVISCKKYPNECVQEASPRPVLFATRKGPDLELQYETENAIAHHPLNIFVDCNSTLSTP